MWVVANINRKTLSLIIPSLDDSPPRAARQFQLAKEMLNILQELCASRTAINKMTLISNLDKMKFSREQNIRNHIAFSGVQITQPVLRCTKFSHSTKIVVMIASWNTIDAFEFFSPL